MLHQPLLYSVEVQLRPSYRRRAGVLPPPAACSAHRADCALRFLVHCGFGRSPPTGGVLGPSATRPCRYALVTTSERMARSLRSRAYFRLVVPLHQLCIIVGPSGTSIAWLRVCGSSTPDPAVMQMGNLRNFPLFNSSSDTEMLT